MTGFDLFLLFGGLIALLFILGGDDDEWESPQ